MKKMILVLIMCMPFVIGTMGSRRPIVPGTLDCDLYFIDMVKAFPYMLHEPRKVRDGFDKNETFNLLEAADEENKAGVERAIKVGADVNAKNLRENSSLYIAVIKKSSPIAKLLIASGAEIPNGLSDEDIKFLDTVIEKMNEDLAKKPSEALSAWERLGRKTLQLDERNVPLILRERVNQMSLSQFPLASKVIEQRKAA